MILNETGYKKTETSFENSSTFQIQQSADAFKILSSNLYKNKIAAVVRELSTNAVDAHKASGIKSPIKVHFPTKDEPILKISDNGVGMTESEIYDLYTTYFGSNKNNTNEFNGAMGLGSKSPFAYTDQFTVESSKEGIRNVFTCFLNDEGIPTLAKVVSNKTRKTGTEVSVPVASSDIHEFKVNMINVYENFETMPEVDNDSILKAVAERKEDRSRVIAEGDNFIFQRCRGSLYNSSKLSVIMGDVIYPANFPDFDSSFVNQVISSNIEIILKMPIGSVDIAPSREELSYDKRTRTNIAAAFKESKKMLIEGINTRLAEMKTEKQKIIFISGLEYFIRGIIPTFSEKLAAYTKETERLHILKPNVSRSGAASLRKEHSSIFNVGTLYKKAVILSITEKDLGKRGMKRSILNYIKKSYPGCYHGFDTEVPIFIRDPSEVEDFFMVKNGCSYITVKDLPEIVINKTPKKEVKFEYEFNMSGIDLSNHSRKVYIVKSMRGSIEIPGNNKYSSQDITAAIKYLEIPTIVLAASHWSSELKKLTRDKKIVELTEKDLTSKLKRKMNAVLKGRKNDFIDLARMLRVFDFNQPLKSAHIFFFDNTRFIETILSLEDFLDDGDEKIKLNSSKIFSKLKLCQKQRFEVEARFEGIDLGCQGYFIPRIFCDFLHQEAKQRKGINPQEEYADLFSLTDDLVVKSLVSTIGWQSSTYIQKVGRKLYNTLIQY